MCNVINRKERQAEEGRVMLVPEAEFRLLHRSVEELAGMHLDLIKMHEEESHLKKHHKAYLHVRDRVDQMCRDDRMKVHGILGRLYCDDVEESPEDVRNSPEYEANRGSEEEMNYCGLRPYLEGRVFVKEDDFHRMVHGMLTLADSVDILREECCYILDGKTTRRKEDLCALLKKVSEETNEICNGLEDLKVMILP